MPYSRSALHVRRSDTAEAVWFVPFLASVAHTGEVNNARWTLQFRATDARSRYVFSQRQQREVLRTWKIKLISSQLAGGLTTG